ncbi:MAG: polyprenol monophosphomannose synthase [Candidatus Neomarinimicrobiota bacterium]
MKTVVVTPTYNERRNISELIRAVNEISEQFHVLVVDDNSPDGTGDYVESLQDEFPNLHLLRRKAKMGLGSAYCEGFKYALKHDFDSIVQMDADLSHDPSEIPRMLDLLTQFDLILGSRYSDGVNVVRWPIRRLILSYGANKYTRWVTGLPVSDATGGFKCWSRKILESIDLTSIRSQGYSFQIEMTFRAWQKGFRIKEIPIIFHDRTVGESKMTRSIMFEAAAMVWRLRVWRIFGWYK